MSEGLLAALDQELYLVDRAVMKRTVDARGLLKERKAMAGIDIHCHPATLPHLLVELTPMTMHELQPPEKTPAGAELKYRGIWVFVSTHEPEGAFVIRHNGNVIGSVFAPKPYTPKPAPSES